MKKRMYSSSIPQMLEKQPKLEFVLHVATYLIIISSIGLLIFFLPRVSSTEFRGHLSEERLLETDHTRSNSFVKTE